MTIGDRNIFYDALYAGVSEGYDTPLSRNTAVKRFKRAVEEMPIVQYLRSMYWFNGRCYVVLTYREFRSAVASCFDRADCYIRMSMVENVTQLSVLRINAKTIDETSLNMCIAFPNGTIDFDNYAVRLSQSSPKTFVTRYFDYEYNSDAKCPLWRNFLDDVLPDKTLQDVLQEFLGAIFINRQRSKVEVMMWLYGDGANGKSVIFNVLEAVLGAKNISNRDIRDLCHATRGVLALSDIEGKLLNYCSDVHGQYTFSDIAKRIISGEPMHAERKYENPRVITNIPLMMANCNILPKLGDKTNAWSRRVMIIPFNKIIPPEKQDKELAYKLSQEKSGILNWILEGRRRYIKQNYQFTPAPQCEILMHKYRSEGFDVLNFMQDENFSSIRYHVGDEGKTVLIGDLYKIYKSWLEVQRAPEYAYLTRPQFRKRLVRYGYIPFHSREGNAIRCYCIRGNAKRGEETEQLRETVKVEPMPQIEQIEQPREDVLDRLNRDIEDEYIG